MSAKNQVKNSLALFNQESSFESHTTHNFLFIKDEFGQNNNFYIYKYIKGNIYTKICTVRYTGAFIFFDDQ